MYVYGGEKGREIIHKASRCVARPLSFAFYTYITPFVFYQYRAKPVSGRCVVNDDWQRLALANRSMSKARVTATTPRLTENALNVGSSR